MCSAVSFLLVKPNHSVHLDSDSKLDQDLPSCEVESIYYPVLKTMGKTMGTQLKIEDHFGFITF